MAVGWPPNLMNDLAHRNPNAPGRNCGRGSRVVAISRHSSVQRTTASGSSFRARKRGQGFITGVIG
jgi:hypothetical protein